MPRTPRLQVAGTYHVTARGVARSPIVIDDADCEAFLSILALVSNRGLWSCRAFCLLQTHFHLLVSVDDGALSTAMHRLNAGYAQSFNRRHGRVGHLFQGRYHSVLVQSDGHLLELARYIALNPVRAGCCPKPEEWPWSSYGSLIGVRSPLPYIDAAGLVDAFAGGGPVSPLQRLRAFVETTPLS
jgi:putative transposase